MSKFIEVEKLIAKIQKFSAAEYGGITLEDDVANSALNYVLEEIIPSLQQEQPEGGCSEKPNDLLSEQEPTCKTCGFYENNCPFTRGKLMVYPNKVCKDYTHSAMKQEQLGVRCEPSPPFNLDEAAGKYAEDTWLVGDNWGDAARRTFKAGAEWMAGKFQKIEGDLVDWHSTSDGKEYCCGIKTDEAFEIPEGFYIRKKQQPSER